MRKVICIAVTTISLVGFSIPAAHAAGHKVVVHGQDLGAAGLLYNSGSCATWLDDPIHKQASTTVYAAYKKPGTIGQRAIGWQFGANGGIGGSEAGPLVFLRSPASLSSLRFSGYVGKKASPVGDLVVYLSPTGSYDDYYAGDLRLNATAKGWDTWIHLSNHQLQWSHWTAGGWSGASFKETIQDLAQASGPNATAYVGPELGCTGRSWYVDDLRVGTGGSTRTYDFEGMRSGSVLGGWRKLSDPTNKVVWGLRHFVRNYSETDWVVGYSGYYTDLPRGGASVGDFVYFGAKGSLYARHYGSKKWHKMATKRFTKKGVAAFKLKHLTKHTDYYFKYAGDAALSPSRTKVMSVDVRAELKGHLTNKTVFRGARLTVAGQRLPGDAGAKVLLQRRLKGHWHTIGSGRTRRHGAFHVSARAGSLGTWALRVVAPKAKGNLGNQTAAFTVRIKKRPAKPAPPVITTPTPCTTCAGGPPDVPIGGKVRTRHGLTSPHGHGRPHLPSRGPVAGRLAQQHPQARSSRRRSAGR